MIGFFTRSWTKASLKKSVMESAVWRVPVGSESAVAASLHELRDGIVSTTEGRVDRAHHIHDLLVALQAFLQRREVDAIGSLRHYRGGRPGSSWLLPALIG